MANGVLMGSLVDLINNTLPKMPRGPFEETLARTNYALTKLIFGVRRKRVESGDEYQTRIRLRANETFRWMNLYGGMAPQKNNVSGIIGTPPAHFMSRGIVFDQREKNINSGPEQIVNTIEMERSAEYENIYEQIEQAMISAGRSSVASADDPPALRGIPYHLRLCITSTNTPVADSEGGFDGVTARFDDGTYTTVRGNGADAQVDCADVENERARNYNFTTVEGWSEEVEERVALAMERTNFEGGIAELKGENAKTEGPTVIWVSTARLLAYEKYVNAGPDDRDGDSRPYVGGLTFRGAPVRKASIFDDWDIDPIVGLRARYIDGITFYGDRWMREMEAVRDPFAPHVVSVPIEGSCNIHCANPRQLGWIGHLPLSA